MENTVSLKIKARDFAIGFFGWIIFHNLLFYFYFNTFFFSVRNWLFSPIILLTVVIVPFVLYKMKRIGVNAGIITAVIINIGMWISIGAPPVLMLSPFPLGLGPG